MSPLVVYSLNTGRQRWSLEHLILAPTTQLPKSVSFCHMRQASYAGKRQTFCVSYASALVHSIEVQFTFYNSTKSVISALLALQRRARCMIGVSLSKPHTSVTALCTCVYLASYAWTDHLLEFLNQCIQKISR